MRGISAHLSVLIKRMIMSLYFAYGSNMNKEQIQERCPSALLLGVASLIGYRLAFTIYSPARLCGCADIVPTPGAVVFGLLYEMTKDDMSALDTFEGHPEHYRRTMVTVQDANMQEHTAFSYDVVTKQEGLLPSRHYLGLLRDAAKEYEFPEEYQTALQEQETS